ncbi:MAG TPA: hypothetical protein PLI89_13455 [Chitinophagales bacterium]|nr:hypothetical protein [Chitinophagales bacterium]
MATYDLTLGTTAGKGANSIAALPSVEGRNPFYKVEAILDIGKMVADGYVCANGDIFQLLEVPANCHVLLAGAYVETVFDGTTPTVDIDFAAGDDIVDGGDVTATGWLAGGTNGMGLVVGGTSTFTQLISTTDTIDVKLIAASADVTVGVLRLVAVLVDLSTDGRVIPTEVTRDQLA